MKNFREIAAWSLVILAILFIGASPFFSLMLLIAAGLAIVIADDHDREIRRGLKEAEEHANKREGRDAD